MAVIYVYRNCSLALATILAIIVLALSAQTIDAQLQVTEQQDIHDSDFAKAFAYADLALTSAVFTIVTVPLMILLDFLRHTRIRSPVLFEVIWLSILWVLYIAAGGLTFRQADFSLLGSCEILRQASPELGTICEDAQPIGILAILAAINLIFCSMTLLGFAATRVSMGQSIWASSLKEYLTADAASRTQPMGMPPMKGGETGGVY